MLADMEHCAYCSEPATVRIVSSPDRVCVNHAIEFWDGLMAYAKSRATSSDREEPMLDQSPVSRETASLRLAS